MTWRVARSLDQLAAELNAAAPDRSRRSDGTIGDAAHASRASDHNPWVPDPAGIVDGIVTARDLTDDDEHGADMAKLLHYLTTVSHDPRIKYLIHNRRIYSSYPTSSAPAWAARPYSGPNAHLMHLHVSVRPEPLYFDDARPWGVAAALDPERPKPAPKPHAPAPTIARAPAFPLRDGYYFGPRLPLSNVRSVSGYYSHADDLKRWQQRMRDRKWSIKVTGRYDEQTERVVRAFQREKNLVVDGLLGRSTWRSAWVAPVTK